MQLPDSAIWIIGTVGVVSVIGAGTFITALIAQWLNGDSTETNGERYGTYCLVGGALLMFALPSTPGSTRFERSVMIGAALLVGSFAGGLVGVAIDRLRETRPAPGRMGRKAISVLSTIAGAVAFVFLAGSCLLLGAPWLEDVPILSPLALFVVTALHWISDL